MLDHGVGFFDVARVPGVVEHPQVHFGLVAHEVRHEARQEIGLHRNAAAVEPGHLEIGRRIPVRRVHVPVVLEIVEYPLGLLAAGVVQAADQQVDRPFEHFADPADLAAASVQPAGVVGRPASVAQTYQRRMLPHGFEPLDQVLFVGIGFQAYARRFGVLGGFERARGILGAAPRQRVRGKPVVKVGDVLEAARRQESPFPSARVGEIGHRVLALPEHPIRPGND